MRLHASLLCACAVLALHARAASIPAPADDLQKKLPEIPVDTNKDVVPTENMSSEQELIDSANTVKDIENNLRVKAIDSIPVSVIVDGDVSNPVENEVPDVKRVKLDLSNPGEPQHQEHDNQNPVHYDDQQQMVTTVKQTVADTQNALKQGFQGVTQGIQNWIANNEQLSSIQASINSLQQSFSDQISKLNSTIHSFWNNRIGSSPPSMDVIDVKPEIETQLKTLENNFQSGVKALSEGVEVFATLKAENENQTPAPTGPNNLFIQYLQLFQNTVTQGFNNVTQAFQNYVGQVTQNNNGTNGGLLQNWNIFNQGSTTPAGAQGDAPASTTRPTIWQGLQSSLQNILNPNQVQNQASGQNTNGASTPNRPIAQAIQNLPFVQGVVNLIQPNKPGQVVQTPSPITPAAEKPAAPAAPLTEPGSNVVPLPEKKPEADVKEPAKKPEEVAPVEAPAADPAPAPGPAATAFAPPPAPANPDGPIKMLIQNNPIVKGVSAAVQRLQASINNPERPRDENKTDEKVDVKGHYGYGSSNNAGDNNNGDGVVLDQPVDTEKVQEPKPEALKVEETRLPVETPEKTDQS